MLPRYSRPSMAALWSEENKLKIWLLVEIEVAKAQAQLGIIPQKAAQAIAEKGRFDICRIAEIEQETRHDVLAFLTNVSENIGEEGRFLHFGMTSTDLVDTALCVQLTQATDMLLTDLDGLIDILNHRAKEYETTPCIGRTHGVHAEPTTFGRKLLGHAEAFKRSRERLMHAREEIAICKLSGAVGNYVNQDPKVEKIVAENLGLKPETIATQVIPRDRHAVYFSTLAVIAGSVENLATEIRHLARTEVREVQEAFVKGQKGSSAMPHKKNPILAENLTGLARLVRSSVPPALENISLWHERDISHSSVERVIAPDATSLLDFALVRLTELVGELIIYPERMKANLESLGDLHESGKILLELIQGGMSREEAYALVQKHAMHVWEHGGLLRTLVKSGP